MDQKLASPDASEPTRPIAKNQTPSKIRQPSLSQLWENWWKKMQGRGWADNMLQLGTILVSLTLVLLILWVMQSFYLKGSLVDVSKSTAGTPGWTG